MPMENLPHYLSPVSIIPGGCPQFLGFPTVMLKYPLQLRTIPPGKFKRIFEIRIMVVMGIVA